MTAAPQIGYALSSEEFDAPTLVGLARRAEEAREVLPRLA
jgi:hypothetical protein